MSKSYTQITLDALKDARKDTLAEMAEARLAVIDWRRHAFIAECEKELAEIDDLIAILNIYQTGNEAGATGPIPEFPAFNDARERPRDANGAPVSDAADAFAYANATNAQQQQQQTPTSGNPPYTTRLYPCGCRAEGQGEVPSYCGTHGVQTPKEPSLADLKAQSANERATRAAKGTDMGNGMMAFDSFEDALDYALDQILG